MGKVFFFWHFSGKPKGIQIGDAAEKALTDLLGRKVDKAEEKRPTPHLPEDTHWWRTIVTSSITSPSSDHITHPPPSPLPGRTIDPNKGQLHSFFPPSIFKASRCRRWSIKYQTYKACGLWGRRRSTSIDTRRRGGGQLGRRRHWLSEVSAAVAHCTAPSSSPNPAQVSSSRAVGWTKNSACPLSPQNPNHDDVGEKKDNCLPGWISVHGWGGLDISELYSEKTVSTYSPGHFYW